jgi:acetylornithine deacetylase/succinyl-diaminopimelate desuccinylase-like protein
MYGHFDKQPHMTGWAEGLSPIDPKIVDQKLYGRGGADDGYAAYTAILSVKALQLQNLAHPRIVILLEGDEESGSVDLPFYLQLLKPQIG